MLNKLSGFNNENVRNVEELGKVQATFATSIFGNVALWLAEALRYLGLGKMDMLTRRDKQFAEQVVLVAMQGIGYP